MLTPRTPEAIVAKGTELRQGSAFSERDRRYRVNWYAYKGEYDKINPNYQPQDGRDRRRDKSEPFIQVWNLIRPVVDTHRLLINRLPNISVPAEIPAFEPAARKSEKQERIYYALWDAGKMKRKHGRNSLNLSLNYAAVWQVVWDAELEIPMTVTRNPGETYPVMKRNQEEVAYCLFYWEQEKDKLAEEYPDVKNLFANRRGSSMIGVWEYVDAERRILVVGNKSASLEPKNVEHNMGVCPVTVTPGCYTDEGAFPSGPVDQLVAVNDAYNRFHTKWGDALEEVLFGHHVVEGDEGKDIPINTGPGSKIWVPTGATYHYEQPKPPPAEAFQELQEMRRMIRDMGTWPEVASGEMDASVITGKAVTRLQGVMAAMAAETQENIGSDLALCNSWMMQMLEKYRPKKKFVLYATAPIAPSSHFEKVFGAKRPTNFTVDFVPEDDIQGYYANQLTYSPFGTDMNASIQSGMQLVKERIAPESWLRNQIPSIGDAEGAAAEIKRQDQERAMFEADLQVKVQERILEAQYQQQAKMAQLQQGAAPEGAPNTEVAPTPSQGGGPAPPPSSPGMGTGGGAPGGEQIGPNATIMPGGAPQLMGMGEPLTGQENFPMEYTPVKPFGPALKELAGEGTHGGAVTAGEEGMPGRTMIRLEDAQSILSQVQNLKGQVFLMGEIVPMEMGGRGATDGPVEVGITNKLDKQTILNAIRDTPLFGRIQWRELPPGSQPDTAMPVAGPSNAQEAAPQPESVGVM